ncbi:MAG: hypothetical protein IPJ08_14795 [Burkholderiales bacterium]|nr:hypothetical protein [Burkholderiales bacterium]
MLAAAMVCVFVPLLMPAWLPPAVEVLAALWSLALAFHLGRYTPLLLRLRADGLPAG